MDRDFKFDVDKAADLLALLASPSRLKVFGLISRNEWSVSALAAEVDLSQSALSQHLKKLRNADVVGVRRDAQNIYYSCSSDEIIKVLKTLEDIQKKSPDAKSVA
ncbi:winged helix-turn-helix transcriptional regulator [Rhizobium sp. CFBP 8752]|uniref:ArsR/SmtB family transcription factor n=1 Tax=unclassified Rhizobium TaxID=2613769 RepID=UPI000713888A|nr:MULTISPECIES: metalloregulator ArsR/SmtB family transcription factor [unclassified Rhizobium]KQQ69900.1 hypothetical protein ASF70_22220 [Rhizobium sp. Leaf321]MBD8665841.1 winged helix-turn-helix transcriptional regulator [Rhizobium sp. CFBP 8752]